MEVQTVPFDPAQSPFTRAMAKGHLVRMGHLLVGHYEVSAEFSILIRECCGEGK